MTKKILILIFMFLSISDANASWFSLRRKTNKILPYHLDKNGSTLSTESSSPSGSITSLATKTKPKKDRLSKNNKVAHMPSEDELEMDQIFVNFESEPITSVDCLKSILSPKITKGYENLSEESARKLLKISRPLKFVLSADDRDEVVTLYLESNNRGNKNILKFGEFEFIKNFEIEFELIDDLGQYLKMVLKFYKKFCDILFKMCLIAILEAEIFTIDQLCEIEIDFPLCIDELFVFACTENVPKVALMLLDRVKNDNIIIKGVKAASKNNHQDLTSSLINKIEAIYGYDSSIYHETVYNLIEDQFKN